MIKISKEFVMSNKSDDNFVKKCAQTYHTDLSLVENIVSLSSDFYINDANRTLRKLQNSEILNSKENLNYDFVAANYIPIFDIMDNNYLCLDIQKKQFCVFNIIDEIASNHKIDIFDLIDCLA